MTKPTLQRDTRIQQADAEIDQGEWQDHLPPFVFGFMRDAGIGAIVFVFFFGNLRPIDLVDGILLSLGVLLALGFGGRRFWKRAKALYRHPGGPIHLRHRSEDSESVSVDGNLLHEAKEEPPQ